ncbi:MAG: LPS translocon maturation chaperone LptM [Xanthobacteraceae bacterium]
MNASANTGFARSAGVVLLLVVSLGLAGCGRKGGLDPPAAASVAEPAIAAPPAAEPALGPDGRPLPPPPLQAPARRSTPIDWLID